MSTPDNAFLSQKALAAYCRGAQVTLPAGVIPERAAEYRRLIKNIFDDTLASAYPLTRNLLSAKAWNKLVTDFILNHPCSNPQVWYMPVEFYEYVSQSYTPLKKRYPYLTELLHFEWLELEVYMMPDEPQTGSFITTADITGMLFTLNAETRIAAYGYPVHLKNARYITPADKGQYFVALHRHPLTGQVLFTNLGVPQVLALQHLAQNQLAGYNKLLGIFSQYLAPAQAEKALNNFLSASVANHLLLVTPVNPN